MLFLGLLFVAGVAFAVQDVAQVTPPKCFLDVYTLNQPHNKFPINQDIYQSPVLIVAPTQGGGVQDNPVLVAYYAINGLRSVSEYHNFQPLYKLLLSTGHLSGLLLSYQSLFGNQFLYNQVKDVVLPENFKVSDFLHGQQFPSVPVLYVAPREVFNNYHFVGLNQIFRFAVTDSLVELVPFQYGLQNNFYNGGYPFSYNFQPNDQIGNMPFGGNPRPYQNKFPFSGYNSFSNLQQNTFPPNDNFQIGNSPVSNFNPQHYDNLPTDNIPPTSYKPHNDKSKPANIPVSNYNPLSNPQQNKPPSKFN